MPGVSDGILCLNFDDDDSTEFAVSKCVACGALFTYNPLLVPSIVGVWDGGKFHAVHNDEARPPNATREPICPECVSTANIQREQRGIEPIRVLPGAYQPRKIEGI